MDLGLYDSDLSLFGGDLLVGLPPTSAELKVTQDVESYEEVTSPWATNDLDVSLGQHELADSTSFTNPVLDKPLELSWMDSRVDLLDLLTQDEEETFMDTTPDQLAIQDSTPGDDAVKLLQSIAEETSQMLAAAKEGEDSSCSINSNSVTLLPTTSSVVAQAADTLQSVVQTEDGVQTSVDHLLDMLAGGVDPGPPDLGSMNVVDSDFLASVSAEEVDSILSSEPSSPAAPYFQESSFSEDSFGQGKHSKQSSNSLLAQYLLSDLGTNSMTPPVSPGPDVTDLESLTSDNLSDDDSDYVPSEYRVGKTRSSPYARKNAKSNSKTVLSKDARLMDKKLRKKQQNKDAATRYRQKKREEAGLIDQECVELENRNTELKEKVEQMTREIGYLKNLLAEVYKARALIKKKK